MFNAPVNTSGKTRQVFALRYAKASASTGKYRQAERFLMISPFYLILNG
jgi:hypothetical protein